MGNGVKTNFGPEFLTLNNDIPHITAAGNPVRSFKWFRTRFNVIIATGYQKDEQDYEVIFLHMFFCQVLVPGDKVK